MNQTHLLDLHTASAYAPLAFPRYRRLLAAGKPETEHGTTVAVGCDVLGQPLGLALGWLPDQGPTGRVLSLSVTPAYRGQGLGTALLAHLEDELARRGAATLRGVEPAARFSHPAAKALMARAGWDTPRLDHVVCMTDLATITKAPWMHDYQLPEGFETFPWDDLTDADVAHLRQWWPEQCQQALADYPEEDMLSPFYEGRTTLPINSLGLRHRGDVVGWMLTDRVAPDVIRYDRLFVAHEYRRLGLGVMLLAASIWAHYRAEGHLAPSRRGVWQTLAVNRSMIAFIRRRMAPYLTQLTEVQSTQKAVSMHPPGPSPPTLAVSYA